MPDLLDRCHGVAGFRISASISILFGSPAIRVGPVTLRLRLPADVPLSKEFKLRLCQYKVYLIKLENAKKFRSADLSGGLPIPGRWWVRTLGSWSGWPLISLAGPGISAEKLSRQADLWASGILGEKLLECRLGKFWIAKLFFRRHAQSG